MSLSGNNVHIYSNKSGKYNLFTGINNPDWKKAQRIIDSYQENDIKPLKTLIEGLMKSNMKSWANNESYLANTCKTIVDWSIDVAHTNSSAKSKGLLYMYRKDTVDTLSNKFSFIGNGVADFILRNIFLVPILIEAHDKIKAKFIGSKLTLDIVDDPEIPASSKIYLTIDTKLDPSTALDTLYEFDQEWWLDEMYKAKGKICIDVMLYEL